MSAEQNLDGIFKGKSVPEYDTVNMAMDIPQEQAVQAIKLASSTGMSLADAAVNSDMQVTNNVAPADLNAIKETHPATASFLNNPIYLSSARNKDDLTSLTNMETSHKYWEALKNGVKGVGYALAGAGQAMSDMANEGAQLPAPTLKDKFFSMDNVKRLTALGINPITTEALTKASDVALKSEYLKAKEVTSDSQLEQFALDVVQNAPQMAAQLALAVYTGGTASMAFMGTQIAGQQYADLKKEGIGTDTAIAASVFNAGLQMPFERLGVGSILKVGKGKLAKKLARVAEATLTEGITEWLQQYPEDVTNLLAKNTEKSIPERVELLKDDFANMTKRGAYAGLIGAFMGGGSSAVHIALRKNVLAANLEQLDKSIKQTAQSPLLAKSPETLADFKNQLSGESQYMVDATALQTYAQEHPNEKLLEKLNINPEELKTAADTQQMIPVNTGDYEVVAAQNSAVHEALKNDIAFSEEGLSKNRADLLNSKEMMKQQEELQAQAEELQTQKDNIYDNLRRIGLNDVESTSTLALLVSNAYRMSPDNPGLWLKEKAPTFIKEKTMPGLITYGQETDVTKAPAFSKWFGDSKVIDGEGKPLVVYHTGSMNESYDITKSRSYTGTPDYEIPGIYLTTEQAESADYGTPEQTKSLYVSIQNPYTGDIFKLHKELGTWRKVMDSLIKQKYDGIINDDGSGEIIAFSANQIKATENNGQFGKTNNIYEQLTNEQKQSAKGMVSWDAEGKGYISLFQTGDMSTIIHEMLGHYFSQNIIEEGAKPDAPNWLKQDRQKLFEYAGLDIPFERATREQQIAAHEKWAEAAETYIMEGKSPNKELAPIFSRFKKWLIAIYDTLRRNPNAVAINDDIRGVFDRMLSAETDVQQAENLEGYLKKLPADFTETLTESEKNRLAIQVEKAHDQAVTNVAKDLLSNFTAERREEINKYKEDLREGAEQEVGKDNLYIASDILLEDNNASNVKAIAKKYLDLNLIGLNIEDEPLTKKQEVWLDTFDMLAENLGFSSGDELAQKIISSPSKEQAIRAIIDGKVNEKFPDYSSEKKERFEKAKEALYNDETGLVLAEESRLIENKVNAMEQSKLTAEENKKSALALRENMKLAAQDELAGKRIPDATNAKRYMTAERKAGEQAAIALANKDYSLALQYKRVQLYNLSLVQEAMNIKREVATNMKYLKQNGKAKRETWIKEEHFVQAAALMERFGVVRKDFDPATKTESLQDWATRIDEMYDNVAIEPWLYSDKQAFTPDKMLTASELVDVVNALKNIKKVAQDEGKFSKLMGGKMLEEVTSKLVEQLTPMETIYTPEPGKDQPVSKAKRYAATSENRDTFLGRLDKWKHGLFTQLFGDSIEEKMNDEVRMRYKYRDTEEALLNECFPTQRDKDNANKKIYYEELKNSTDKMTLIELALNVGSESSKRVVMGTPPVGFENSPLWVKGDALTTEDNVMRFLGKTLNVNEWNYVEGAWKNMKFLWPLAQEVQRQATGFANKGVVATPFEVTLADGTKKILPGGYHPLKKDYRIGLQSNENVDESAPLYEQNKGIRTMHTYTGYQIARTGATYAISLSPGTRFGIVDQIIKDINFRILAGDFRKLLNNEQFAGTLKSKIGREGYGVFKEYLQTSSNPWTESVGEGEKNLSSILMWLRSKVIHVAIMVKFHTAFQNLGNFPLYAHADEDFSYGDMAEGTRRAIFDYNTPGKFKDAYDFATSKSIFIRERTALPDIAIKEIVNSDKQNAMEKKTANWGVQMLSFTDNLSGIPMWTVAYEKYIKQGKTEKEAVRFADGVVRKTLGSSRSTDTASILRTGSTMRILTMFQTFFNTQYQQWAKEANIFMSEKDVGRLTAFVASKWLMFCFLNMLTNLQNPFDEKDREEFYKDVLTYPMQIAGPAGQIGTEVIKRAGGFKTFGYRMSAVQSAIDGTINTAGKIGSVARGEAEPSAIVEPLANTLGMYYGVPGQFNTLFFNGYDTLFNNMEPRPTDIMKRRPKRER